MYRQYEQTYSRKINFEIQKSVTIELKPEWK